MEMSAGAVRDANYWTVDGVSANFGISSHGPGDGASGSQVATNVLGGTNAIVSVDALKEFRIDTSTYSPEFGRLMGGQISILTRSGTNQFHGDLFDYLRNGDLDAEDWFADHYGLSKAQEIQNDFGGVVAGPIIRDKSFFFFSYEGLRVVQPYTLLATVPDMASRTAGVASIQPFINMFPLPAANAPDTLPGSGISSYQTTYSNPATSDAYSLRIDHQVHSNLNFFARYNQSPSNILQRSQGYTGGPANDVARNPTITKTATAGLRCSQCLYRRSDLSASNTEEQFPHPRDHRRLVHGRHCADSFRTTS